MATRAKKEHRSLSESKNYQKQRIKVAKLHKHAAAQNEAFQHLLSKAIIESQDIVCVEKMNVRNMMQNHHLARAITDCSWASFITKLSYKAELYGKQFVKVPAAGTTQTCSNCGYVMSGEEKLTLSDREWTCPNCGRHHIRDWNSAINIKNRGLAILQTS